MIHNTHFAQYIPPTAFHCVTGTYTDAAGAVAGTIAKHRAAAASTGVINIPVAIPSNSIALQGAKLASVELDYELLLAAATSVTLSMNKITRGADTAVAVVAAVAGSQDIAAAAGAETQDQHRVKWTLTTPVFIDNDEEFLLVATIICGAVVTVDLLGAVANYTLRA
jgi:hypothetical protein